MTDATTPLRKSLNLSGIPFQLAVEKAIETMHPSIEVIGSEIPWANGFIDVVARQYETLFVFECNPTATLAEHALLSQRLTGA